MGEVFYLPSENESGSACSPPPHIFASVVCYLSDHATTTEDLLDVVNDFAFLPSLKVKWLPPHRDFDAYQDAAGLAFRECHTNSSALPESRADCDIRRPKILWRKWRKDLFTTGSSALHSTLFTDKRH